MNTEEQKAQCRTVMQRASQIMKTVDVEALIVLIVTPEPGDPDKQNIEICSCGENSTLDLIFAKIGYYRPTETSVERLQ